MSVLDDEFVVDAELGHKTEKVSVLLRLGNELIDNIRKTIYEYDDPKKSAYPSAYQIESALHGVNISIEQLVSEQTHNISKWTFETEFGFKKTQDVYQRKYTLKGTFDSNNLLDDATLWIYSDAETSQKKEHWLMDQFCYISVISACITLELKMDVPLSKRFDFSGIVR